MIHVTNASVSKGAATILKQISVDVPKGALTAIVGPNGAGKTTFLRLIAGLEGARQGSVKIDGSPIETLSAADRAKYISWVPTSAPIPCAFTALETVALGLFALTGGSPNPAALEKAKRALAEVDAAHLAMRDITTLSSGERQRIMIARAMVARCPVLLLDEPLANLDIAAALHLVKLLQQQARTGVTICASFHDIALARKHADYVVLMNKGQITAAGGANEVLSRERIFEVFGVQTQIAVSERGAETLDFSLP